MLFRLVGLLFAGLSLAGCTLSVTAPESAFPEAQDQGAFFALSAADADALADWYVKHLNFERRASGANEERVGILLKRPGMLLEIASFGAARPRTSLAPELESYLLHGIFKVGFVVDDLEASYANARDASLEVFFPIVSADDNWRTFAILDPEGNIIQFFGR